LLINFAPLGLCDAGEMKVDNLMNATAESIITTVWLMDFKS
jgi:hypothetical protein